MIFPRSAGGRGAPFCTQGASQAMSNPAEEIERGRAIAERAVRELCQAQGTKQPRLEWGATTDDPQRLGILIEDLDPIEVELSISSLEDRGGMATARVVRRALLEALRSR